MPLATHIAIDLAPTLRATRVTIDQMSGAERRRGRATRDSDSKIWLIEYGDEPRRQAPADAIPAELVSVLLYASQRRYQPGEEAFSGRVLLPGHGFALAYMRVVATDDREFAVTLTGQPSGPGPGGHSGPTLHMRGRWRITHHGNLARAGDANGVTAVRVHPDELAVPFDPPEMVLAASIPVRGMHSISDASVALVIDAVDRAPPPPLPGQLVRAHGRTWRVQLAPGDRYGPREDVPVAVVPAPRFRQLAERIIAQARVEAGVKALSTRAELDALVRATDRLIDDDLSAPVTEARAALALGRGDCTAHAVLFYELAHARGIPAKVVTGYRLDDDRLVRHRWALAAVDGVWLAVDPTHGEVPAQARLLGLLAHGPSAAELALVDETAFAGFAQAVARFGTESP